MKTKETKLNSFILKGNTIEKMKEMIGKTKKDRKEREFDFCKYKNNVIMHMHECTGNECWVASRRRCTKGEFVGTFHTHPQPLSERPSTSDLFNIMSEGMGCIGSAKTNKTKCYFFDRSKGYDYIRDSFQQLHKLESVVDDIVGENGDKPEFWPEISRKLEDLREMNYFINQYIRTVKIA